MFVKQLWIARFCFLFVCYFSSLLYQFLFFVYLFVCFILLKVHFFVISISFHSIKFISEFISSIDKWLNEWEREMEDGERTIVYFEYFARMKLNTIQMFFLLFFFFICIYISWYRESNEKQTNHSFTHSIDKINTYTCLYDECQQTVWSAIQW